MVDKCIDDVIKNDPRFSTFLTFVEKAKLDITAKAMGNCYNQYNNISESDYDQTQYKKLQYTYFVPTNEAFENVPKEVLDFLLDNATNPNALRELLLG